MLVYARGLPGCPRGSQNGTCKRNRTEFSTRGHNLPTGPKKGKCYEHEGFTFNLLPGGRDGKPSRVLSGGVQDALTTTQVSTQISCTVWVRPGLEKILPMGPHPGPANGQSCRLLRRP